MIGVVPTIRANAGLKVAVIQTVRLAAAHQLGAHPEVSLTLRTF
jgi:hypothetical protein